MDVKLAQMNVILLKKSNRIFSIICAGLLFLAIFNLPIGYFTILRIVISIGALFIAIENIKTTYWAVIFVLMTILFNPVFPIFFHNKEIWVPIDIICAALFLIEALELNRHKKEENRTIQKTNKKYTRDKIL
jgi:hypothetical protein|tara:strand:- start:2507 stop:2902 length:396 start_codon:yes stop_codon:yes gene_type:complete